MFIVKDNPIHKTPVLNEKAKPLAFYFEEGSEIQADTTIENNISLHCVIQSGPVGFRQMCLKYILLLELKQCFDGSVTLAVHG